MTAHPAREALAMTQLRIDLAWEINLLSACAALVFVGAIILGVF